jgi:hypothetical protein
MSWRYSLSVFLVGGTLVLAASCNSADRAAFGGVDASEEASGPTGFGDAGDARPCIGLQCQQQDCASGETTVTGTVFAPNGKLPMYNAIVYVPNDPLEDLPAGVTCDQCGKVSGSPVVTALSDAKGEFTLHNMPVGANIPLVIQVGKWRRQTTIPNVKACEENKLTDAELTRLPKNQSEGNMPRIALTTGQCDNLGCMLPKIGIDPSEFGTEADGPSKSVHVYTGATGESSSSWSKADSLWNDSTKMQQYDMLILSCECGEHLENKGGAMGPSFGAMTDYLNAGGRIFTSDFMYSWYRYTPDADMKSAMNIRGGAPGGGSPIDIDTSFPKGQALSDWLGVTVPGSNGKLTPDVVYANIISVDDTKAQKWGASGDPLAGPRILTVNLPVGLPPEQQCGKGVHLDAHVNQGDTGDTVNGSYPSSCGSGLKPGENLLAFFFFDLASCIQKETDPPQAPPVK